MDAVWKPIHMSNGLYEASSDGRVRRSSTRRVKAMCKNDCGYLRVSLRVARKAFKTTVHRCVADAFIGPASEGVQVNHIDGNKVNNVPENLEYVTPSENMRHAVRNGLHGASFGENNGSSKLTTCQVIDIYSRAVAGESLTSLANECGVLASAILKIRNGTNWSHVTGAAGRPSKGGEAMRKLLGK